MSSFECLSIYSNPIKQKYPNTRNAGFECFALFGQKGSSVLRFTRNPNGKRLSELVSASLGSKGPKTVKKNNAGGFEYFRIYSNPEKHKLPNTRNTGFECFALFGQKDSSVLRFTRTPNGKRLSGLVSASLGSKGPKTVKKIMQGVLSISGFTRIQKSTNCQILETQVSSVLHFLGKRIRVFCDLLELQMGKGSQSW